MKKNRTLCILIIVLCAGIAYVGYEEIRERQLLSDVRTSYTNAQAWLQQNQQDNGLFYYIYNPRNGNYPASNNAIRQLMASRLVAVFAHTDSVWQSMHDKNLSYIFSHWYRVDEEKNIGYVYFDNKSKLGANAMLLRTLVASPQFVQYESQSQQLVNGILALQQQDGAFVPWYIEPDYAYDAENLLTFYSGEAILALIEYYELTGDARVLDAAIRSQDFYVQRYVHELEQYYYPAYVPWHTMSLYRLYHITGDDRYAEAVFTLTDTLLELQDTTAHKGRFYNPQTPQYGTPHAASDGVYTEGLAYAHALAHERHDWIRTYRYHRAMALGAYHLMSLQYTKETIGREPDIWRLEGAFKYRSNDSRIRVDTTQHAIDAYSVILNTL